MMPLKHHVTNGRLLEVRSKQGEHPHVELASAQQERFLDVFLHNPLTRLRLTVHTKRVNKAQRPSRVVVDLDAGACGGIVWTK